MWSTGLIKYIDSRSNVEEVAWHIIITTAQKETSFFNGLSLIIRKCLTTFSKPFIIHNYLLRHIYSILAHVCILLSYTFCRCIKHRRLIHLLLWSCKSSCLLSIYCQKIWRFCSGKRTFRSPKPSIWLSFWIEIIYFSLSLGYSSWLVYALSRVCWHVLRKIIRIVIIFVRSYLIRIYSVK